MPAEAPRSPDVSIVHISFFDDFNSTERAHAFERAPVCRCFLSIEQPRTFEQERSGAH